MDVFPPNDKEFSENKLIGVKPSGDGWEVTRDDQWMFWLPPGDYPEPTAGMTLRSYGKGVGFSVRGAYVDGHRVFYRTADEQQKHEQVQSYGADAADWLRRWDEGRSVWSVEMGGLGPGYEQCIQITAAEILRWLLAEELEIDGISDSDWKVAVKRIEKEVMYTKPVSELGLSGAQWGAAHNLAMCIYRRGPIAALTDEAVKDRLIQCSNRMQFVST